MVATMSLLLSVTSLSVGYAAAPYRFYWNVGGLPSNYSTSDYTWIKRKSVELFTTYFGDYPLLRDQNDASAPEQWCNGGLPQLANLSAHTEAAVRDVRARVNDSNWDGFAVVDYESWSEFNGSSTLYQAMSVALELKADPSLSPEVAFSKAEISFNKAAVQFMLATNAAVRQVIPKAKVGYYGHPTRCYWSCDWASIFEVNMQFAEVWRDVDALFPSIYQFYPNATFDRNQQYVNATLLNAKKVAAAVGGKPVFPYAWPRYHTGNVQYLKPKETWLSFVQPQQMGCDGTIIWSDEDSAHWSDFTAWLQSNKELFNGDFPPEPPHTSISDSEAHQSHHLEALDHTKPGMVGANVTAVYEQAEQVLAEYRQRGEQFPPVWQHCSL